MAVIKKKKEEETTEQKFLFFSLFATGFYIPVNKDYQKYNGLPYSIERP